MEWGVIFVCVNDDQEYVVQEFVCYNFIVILVVDNVNRFVGIVMYDDVLDVVWEEVIEDVYWLGVVELLEDSYLETLIFIIGWKCGVWLLILVVMVLFIVNVLDYYQDDVNED